jgi:hypothetical protein
VWSSFLKRGRSNGREEGKKRGKRERLRERENTTATSRGRNESHV